MRPSNNTKLRAIPDRLTNNLKQQRWLFFLILFFVVVVLLLLVFDSSDVVRHIGEEKRTKKRGKKQ